MCCIRCISPKKRAPIRTCAIFPSVARFVASVAAVAAFSPIPAVFSSSNLPQGLKKSRFGGYFWTLSLTFCPILDTSQPLLTPIFYHQLGYNHLGPIALRKYPKRQEGPLRTPVSIPYFLIEKIEKSYTARSKLSGSPEKSPSSELNV